jgi:transcriptional repressor NrdR
MINQDKRPSQKPRKGLFYWEWRRGGCSICTSLSKIDEQLEFTGMQCPSCQHTDSRVLESRAADSGRSVRRRRECLNCDFRFTTYERVETVPITVLKRNGHRETFNRSKLLHGLLRACEKTGLAPASLEVVVDEIEICLQQRAGREVTSNEIGEMVLQQLREMSDVAYVRFASVYRQFKSVSDFVSALEVLGEPTPNRGKNRATLAAVP